MKRALLALIAVVLLGAPQLICAEPDVAERALADGIPAVAAQKLSERLAGRLSEPERIKTLVKLANALLAANRADEAFELLRHDAWHAEIEFCKARALGALGRWSEALPIFRELADEDDPQRAEAARLCEAEALRALRRPQEALAAAAGIRNPGTASQLRLAGLYVEAREFAKCRALLGQIEPRAFSDVKWKQYVEARLLLAEKHPGEALAKFQDLLKSPRGVTESMLAGATLGMTEAQIALDGPEAASGVLEEFIAAHPDSAQLGTMFERLDQLYGELQDPSDAELQKWMQAPPTSRAAYATFYLARSRFRENKHEKGMRLLTSFTRAHPDHPLAPRAFSTLGGILEEEGKLRPALQAYEDAMRRAPTPEFLARVETAAGRVCFRLREYVLAANAFQNAASRAPQFWETGTFNAALSWLHQGNYERFLSAYQELSMRAPESELRRSLLLEEGLFQARARDPRAVETLELFVKDFADHRRTGEARVALAELAFADHRVDAASRYLRVVNEGPTNDVAAERAEYLAIFLADAPEHRDGEKVIALCQNFLRQRSASALIPQIRMKLSQVYFRREDFANAQTQCELLAREQPEGPLAETALFLAGRAAMRSMASGGMDRALELLEGVAKLNGPLKPYARAEQAIAQARLGHEKEAIILYDNVLAGSPEPELRFAALCGRADNLYAIADTDEQAYVEAIAAYEKLAAEPDVTAVWRNQALYKKAKCLERQKKNTEAIAAFYDVLDAQTRAAADPEYFWFYKAGFDAAQLLEADQKWPSAIGIYEKLATVTGPRSAEAKARATQLRLEHFVWE